MSDPSGIHEAIREEAGTVLIGNDDAIETLTIALLTRGHLLMEGVPGVAKTTIANLFARTTGLEYNRIQMTPDILPADITGTHVYREQTGEFVLRKGPVFANLVVADEINRATPKTQSALLEAMQERRVTIEGNTHPLPEPFLVIATQNPLEMEGSLHPEETVYMNGGLWEAREALDYAKSNGTLIHENEDSRIYDADLSTQTLTESGDIRDAECLLYEKDFEGRLYHLRTKTGREISVSGNHPFLVNRNGALQWIDARNLEEDDHLVSPRTVSVDEREFPTHEEALAHLEAEYDVVSREEVADAKRKLQGERGLTRSELDTLRIACEWSKTDLAERVSGSYDQVCNFLSGCHTPIGDELAATLREQTISVSDYVESHRIHRFDDTLTEGEAGFLTGFVLSDGRLTETRISITQKNLTDAFERWVSIVEGFGVDVRITDLEHGVRRATVDSKPFVEYLRYRYDIDAPDKVLDAPERFRREFLDIFVRAESHYDAEARRITFVQKDRETTNVIAHLLLQFGIRPWIKDAGERFEIRIQGEDLRTYTEQFDWRGEAPDTERFAGRHRTVPLPAESVERLVDVLGVRFEGDMMDQEWYNAYQYLRSGEGPTSEHLAHAFVEAMRDRVDKRCVHQPKTLASRDLGHAAKLCGLAMTDIVDQTDLSKYRVWQAYTDETPPEEAVEFVANRFTNRIQEAEKLTTYLESLVDSDVFYDPLVEVESEPYDGSVIGLSVPHTHNYLAGLGACGINHNTFELPEAQRDRFQFKLTIDIPDRDEERELLDRFDVDPDLSPEQVEQVVEPEDLLAARKVVTDVRVADEVKEYILDLVAATRESPDVEHGASPRAAIAFLNAGKARAAIRDRKYVIPDDVKALAEPILVHRLVLSTDAELSDRSARAVVADVVSSVTAPGADVEPPSADVKPPSADVEPTTDGAGGEGGESGADDA